MIEFISDSERSSHVHIVYLNLGVLPEGHALGTRWNTDADSREFTINTSIDAATSIRRRSMLATIASLYGPLGCISPFVLKGKLILQQICREDIYWDNPMPIHLEPRWKEWRNDLHMIPSLNIPRCYLPPQFGKISRREVHFFSNASEIGNGQCTYLRQLNELGEVHCCLVFSKVRVTPLKWSLFRTQN